MKKNITKTFGFLFTKIVCVACFTGCTAHKALPTADAPELIFQTNFEKGTYMTQTLPQYAELRGADLSLPKPNDWVADFDGHPNVGTFRLYYEEGDSTQRLAELVADPVDPKNTVLRYKISVPNVKMPSSYTKSGIVFSKKSRIQSEMYANNGLMEIYQSVKLFIPTDFNKYINSPYPVDGDWLGLCEFWNNAAWMKAPYPFRFGVTVGRGDPVQGSPLYFKTDGQKLDDIFIEMWHYKNTTYPIPIGKWMTLEYYIKSGNKGNGRFYFAVSPDGGTKTVIWDLHNDTCHPDDPNPDGFSEVNSMKLYASDNMVNQMNAMGGTFQVYWDDFKIWKNKKPSL